MPYLTFIPGFSFLGIKKLIFINDIPYITSHDILNLQALFPSKIPACFQISLSLFKCFSSSYSNMLISIASARFFLIFKQHTEYRILIITIYIALCHLMSSLYLQEYSKFPCLFLFDWNIKHGFSECLEINRLFDLIIENMLFLILA